MQIMKMIFEGGWLAGNKTYVTVFLSVVGAVAAYLTGEASLMETFSVIGPMVGLGFLRGGVAKN